MGEGYPINWAMGTGKDNIRNHPAFEKYAFTNLGSISVPDLQQTLAGLQYNTENQAIASYLGNLLRLCILIA